MSKVLIVGVDGLDPDLVHQWQNELPSFRKIFEEGNAMKAESVFPPDSVAAWATIFTGESPAQHGIMEHINYLGKRKENVGPSDLGGKTFWDMASKAGKKVCVINPFLAYPVWPVNGVMVSGPVFYRADIQSYPPTSLPSEEMPEIGGITDFPSKKNLDEFIEKIKVDIERLYNFSNSKFNESDYDLCFVTFLQLDRIQHFLWRYTDPDDCTYPGPNRYSDSIKDFYKQIDKVIGRFMENAGRETALIVISDHGHGRRCTKVININEILRKAGYMKSKVNRLTFLDYKYLLEKVKLGALEMVYKWDMEDLMFAVTKFIPNRKALKNSTFITDNDTSLAHTSTFAGTNPFGGITINRDNITQRGLDYEDLRSEIITLLKEFKDEKTGYSPFEWVRRREEIDNGPFINIYPDILFKLDDSCGVNWALHTKIIGTNTTHKKVSGGHKYYGYCGILNSSFNPDNSNIKIKDIASMVLSML